MGDGGWRREGMKEFSLYLYTTICGCDLFGKTSEGQNDLSSPNFFLFPISSRLLYKADHIKSDQFTH